MRIKSNEILSIRIFFQGEMVAIYQDLQDLIFGSSFSLLILTASGNKLSLMRILNHSKAMNPSIFMFSFI
jgi:hypothetical protein